MKKIKSKNKKKTIIITISSIFVLGLSLGLFLLYGPYSGFRDLWITTAMTTMEHQYLARIFYKEETINKVLEKNLDCIKQYDKKLAENILMIGQEKSNLS